jgi:chemotaxis protein methyltransferase CheR
VTDFSERVLNKAKEGIYTQLEVQRGLPARLLIRYFEKESENSWKVTQALRDKLQFKKLNLLEPFPHLGTFDIIFCRNVLIYQSVPNKVSVVEKFANLLDSKRYLILGATESLLGISNEFSQEIFETAVYYKKKE